MKFEKGKEKTGGRKSGIKNKKTLAWESLGNFIIGKGAEKAIRILENMDDEKFLLAFEKFLEYFKPKLQRMEAKIDVDANIYILPYNTEYLPNGVK